MKVRKGHYTWASSRSGDWALQANLFFFPRLIFTIETELGVFTSDVIIFATTSLAWFKDKHGGQV